MVKTKASTQKRPAIWASTAFMAGVIFGVTAVRFNIFREAAFAILFLVLAGVVYAFIKKNNYIAVVCAFSIAAAFLISSNTYSERLRMPPPDGDVHVISGVIDEIDKIKEDGTRYRLTDVYTDGKKLSSDILITVSDEMKLRLPGTRLTFSSKLYKPKGATNSKVFDYTDYLANNRIYYVAYISNDDVVLEIDYEMTKRSLKYEIKRFKYYVTQRYSNYLSTDALGIVTALTSGETVFISDGTYDLYRITGTAHVLAISGLHVGFAVIFASLVTRRMRKNSVAYALVNLSIVWIYIIFAGMSVSAFRAGMFFTFFSIGKALKLRCNITNIAFLTALIMLIFDPLLLFSVSFQLSFAAVLAIGILAPSFTEMLSRRMPFIPSEIIRDSMCVVCASIGVLLPIAYHYNSVSLVSIIANVITVPLYSYIAGFAFVMFTVTALGITPLVSAVSYVINGLVYIVHNVLSFASLPSFATINVPSPDIFVFAVFVLLVWILSVEKPKCVTKRVPAAILCVLLIVARIIIPYTGLDNVYRVSFIDVGQAECTLIVTPYNKTVMIDAGTSYGSTGTAEYTIVPYLLKHGNTSIDYLVLSHDDSDHVGEVINVLNSVDVKNIVYFGKEDSPDFTKIFAVAIEKGITLINMNTKTSISVDKTTQINRICDYYSQTESNDRSLVMEIICSQRSLIFAGDMSREGLDTLTYAKDAFIYKVAHHGSKGSISQSIRQFSPDYSVIFTKAGNVYGLPDEETIDFLSEFSEIKRIDESGEIRFEFNDRTVRIFEYIR